MVEIREANVADSAKIAAIHNECLKGTPWSEALYIKELEDPAKHYFVAETKGEIIGFAGFAQILDEAHIMNVAVSLVARRQGVASMLLERLINYAAKCGIAVATLEVRISNKPAVALYEKKGFASLGVRPNYYDGHEGAEIMELRIR